MDPQGHLGKSLGLDVRRTRRSALDLLLDSVLGDAGDAASLDAPREPSLPAVPSRIRGLDVVVANKSLALFPAWGDAGEEAAADPSARLATALGASRAAAGYDLVLIDAPPSFGPLTLNVLRACDEVVVPVPLTYLALDGCAELTRTLETVRTRFGHPGLRLSMVVPTFYRRTRLAAEVLDTLKKRFPKEIAQTVLGMHVKIDEAQSRGLTIWEYAPRDRGAAALAALAEELEARAGPAGEEQP